MSWYCFTTNPDCPFDLNSLYETKPTILVQAVRQGDIDAVKDLLRSRVAHPNSADHRGWTALHEAAALNQLTIVKMLLEDERTNPDASAHEGHFALDVAVIQNASLELICCLAKRTSVFVQEKYASRLLYKAAIHASADIVKYIITNTPADIQGKKQFEQRSPVLVAMARKDDEVIEVLLDACEDINDLYDNIYHRETIVFAIKSNCSLHIIKLLISKGATLNFETTSLMHAIGERRIDVALELLKHDVDVNRETDGSTALTSAILIGETRLVKQILCLVSFQVLESLCEKEGFKGVICCALSHYHSDILSMLLNSHFSEQILEAPVKIRFRLPRLNLWYGYIGPLAFFLKEIMDLHEDGSLSTMQLLLSKGISVEPRKPSYLPPLVGALLVKSRSDGGPPPSSRPALKILLDSGVNVDHTTSVLPDALLIAVHKKNFEAFLMLLPYSQYTPCDIVRIGIERNMDFLCTFVLENMIEMDDYLELKSLLQNDVERNERCDELFSRFSFDVAPLTVIARRKVRQCLRKSCNSSQFLGIINDLVIPETLKCYLRYL